MGWASRAGDWAFKGFTAGLGLATIYLTATFSVNVYRGLAWHNAQSKVGLTHSNKELECLPLKVVNCIFLAGLVKDWWLFLPFVPG